MAIEKTRLVGSLNVDEMAPVASTAAAQNRSAPDLGQSKPHRRERSPEKDGDKDGDKNGDKDKGKNKDDMEKDSTESPAADEEQDTGRPPHRIDSLA
jgi:hypothetical protein